MRPILASLLLLGSVCATAGAAAVELPFVFSDGMVLQRDRPVPVWGRSEAGATVVVRLDGRSTTAQADAHGRWRVVLPPHAAGGPYELRVEDGQDVRVMHDVLVGEVWLASGQSNMEMPLSQTDGAAATTAAANDPLVRHFKIPKSWAGTPQWQLQGGGWVAASPASVGDFSAPAYYFALELRKSTGVPVGIIDSTWGGSRIEAWTELDALGMDAAAVAKQAQALTAADALALAETNRRLARWPQLLAGGVDDAGWQAASLATADWADSKVPGLWESAGWNGMDGIAWYRTGFVLTEAEARAGVLLGVGRIDDSDTTWVNGVQVGQTLMQYNTPRAYTVPPSALHAGENSIAVRVQDTGGGGGIHGDPGEVFVQPTGGARRSLAGTWKFHPARVTVALVDDKNQYPALLYNAMIHPLGDYSLRGVIWYQGEANAANADDALHYRTLFPSMIRQWRAQFGQPAMPFLWVQLASFGSGADTATQSPWSILRESQSAALALPATAQAVTIDIGNPVDIHPRNKRDVGLRLARAARHVAYGEALDWHGPMPAGFGFDGARVRVRFDAGSTALATRGGAADVRGFSVAGADRVFHPASARIEGTSVVVRSDAVATPVAVRYAWHDDAGDADLANSAGLPASPFRSDEW